MGTFDIIIMLAGGLLIISGLVLFVSGKRETGKNNVEAFGIKVDVSNPSILLIAFGVILLLVPRLLPDNRSSSSPGLVKQNNVSNNTTTQSQLAQNQAVQNQPITATNIDKPPQPSLPTPAAVLLPSGNYELYSYQENGIASHDVEGIMVMQPSGSNTVNWTAQLGGYNDFGQMTVFQYAGFIRKNGSNWSITITGSTDPTYINQGETILQLGQVDDEMTMQYQYLGSLITMAWEKTN